MKKILIVDDQTDIRELIAETLGADEFRILKSGTGRQAVDTAKMEKPDLIIMDIMMPGEIDGLEATRLIKADPRTRECHIILLSAKGQEADRIRGKSVGANDYFVKPFSPTDLLNKVEETLN
ncbi:MAG: PleD family two-component system response regulator [Nitrospinaceae bacterium]